MDTQPYLRPAGFWIRVAAHIIHTLILCVPFGVVRGQPEAIFAHA